MEVVRLEEFTGVIQGQLVVAWQAPDAVTPWIPTEFMPAAYVTRILVTGRTAAAGTALAADPSWTQVWRSPGAKEWACLLGVLPHMPGPMLVVVGPDVGLSAKLVGGLKAATGEGATVIVLRAAGGTGAAGWGTDMAPPDQLFLPVLEGRAATALMPVFQEWAGRCAPRFDSKVLLPQLAAQGYGLTASGGRWWWYRPAESTGLTTLSVSQVARQLVILGGLLEKAGGL
jgi:hypothetical protein